MRIQHCTVLYSRVHVRTNPPENSPDVRRFSLPLEPFAELPLQQRQVLFARETATRALRLERMTTASSLFSTQSNRTNRTEQRDAPLAAAAAAAEPISRNDPIAGRSDQIPCRLVSAIATPPAFCTSNPLFSAEMKRSEPNAPNSCLRVSASATSCQLFCAIDVYSYSNTAYIVHNTQIREPFMTDVTIHFGRFIFFTVLVKNSNRSDSHWIATI